MANEIINRVAKSPLKTIDLEELYPTGKRILLDISPWLYKGIILKEKEFRNNLKNHDWTQYQDTYVALKCSEDAIIPSWAYLLVATYVHPHAKLCVVGELELLETLIFENILNHFDFSPYQGKPVILKGCANKPIPPTAYLRWINKLQNHSKSILYGEACSTVPLFKSKLT